MKMISPDSGSLLEAAEPADELELDPLPQAAAMPPSDARPASCMVRLSITSARQAGIHRQRMIVLGLHASLLARGVSVTCCCRITNAACRRFYQSERTTATARGRVR